MRKTNLVEIDMAVAAEALDCVAVRVRWYETRNMDVPSRTAGALAILADALGLDPRRVGKP